jgi:hypothetical protein
LVGTAALLSSNSESKGKSGNFADALLGVALMLAGSFVQAIHFLGKIKSWSSINIKVPPLLRFGVEGVWGFVVSLFVLWPAGYWLKYEDPF